MVYVIMLIGIYHMYDDSKQTAKRKLGHRPLNQGISYPQIAKQAHVSFSNIKRIRQKVTEDDKKG